MGAWERTISNLDERIRADLLDMVAIRVGTSGARGFRIGRCLRRYLRFQGHTTD